MNSITVGEIKLHHHRNNLTEQLRRVKEQQAWNMFNDHYVGSEPTEADFIEFVAQKMESGEISETAPFKMAMKEHPDGFIIVFLTDDNQPIAESAEFLEWKNTDK
jgi:hypothetical protein